MTANIKLKHSGGNSLIIAGPSSNPASDRTLTLPSDADGTLLSTNDIGNSSSTKIRKITTSTSAPSGGSDGDIWIKYTA